MAQKSLFIANPFDQKHMQMVENYEKKSNLNGAITAQFSRIKNVYDAQSYEEHLRIDNEFEQLAFLTTDANQELIVGCLIHGYKDIKACYLTLLPAIMPRQTKPLLREITAYAIKGLGMEEVFITIGSSDNTTALAILESGYEDLGEENGIMSFMTDKDNYMMMEGLLDGNNKKY